MWFFDSIGMEGKGGKDCRFHATVAGNIIEKRRGGGEHFQVVVKAKSGKCQGFECVG